MLDSSYHDDIIGYMLDDLTRRGASLSEEMKKIRLTKKRCKALENAISLDDILHEKFIRMWDDLRTEERRFARMKRVCQVVRREGKIYRVLQILEVQRSPDGMRLIVR